MEAQENKRKMGEAMIQIHTVESIETAIQLGVLIPHDAAPKSRHRFWIGEYRVDAYLNPDRKLFVHWLHRPTGEWRHPRPDGCNRAVIPAPRTNQIAYFFYGCAGEDNCKHGDCFSTTFRPSTAPPGPGEGGVGKEV